MRIVSRGLPKKRGTYSKIRFTSNGQIATHMARESKAVRDRVVSGR